MQAIETTATVDEDCRHLTLRTPLPGKPDGEVKIIIHLEETPASKPSPTVDFTDAVGELYRLFPDAPRRTTAEWMEELRGGEER